MKIKPLEWNGSGDPEWFASTPFGDYFIYRVSRGFSRYWNDPYCCGEFGKHKTLDNAKRACEAHWQERVKRCLID